MSNLLNASLITNVLEPYIVVTQTSVHILSFRLKYQNLIANPAFLYILRHLLHTQLDWAELLQMWWEIIFDWPRALQKRRDLLEKKCLDTVFSLAKTKFNYKCNSIIFAVFFHVSSLRLERAGVMKFQTIRRVLCLRSF